MSRRTLLPLLLTPRLAAGSKMFPSGDGAFEITADQDVPVRLRIEMMNWAQVPTPQVPRGPHVPPAQERSEVLARRHSNAGGLE